jgi:hypothetical protein
LDMGGEARGSRRVEDLSYGEGGGGTGWRWRIRFWHGRQSVSPGTCSIWEQVGRARPNCSQTLPFCRLCRVFRLYTQQNNLCRVFFSKTHGKLRPIFRSFYIFNFMYLIITSLKFGLYKAYFFTIFSFFISLLCLYYINPSEMLCGAGKPARSRYTFRQNQCPFGYDA